MSAFHLSTTAGQTQVWLEPQLGQCTLACRFCPQSLVADRPSVDDAGALDEVLAELLAAIGRADAPVVHLEGADALAFPRVVELVSRLGAAGKTTVIATPGTLLADPAFVARLAGLDVAFELPYHAADPDVWARITGSATHRADVEAALANLAAAGIPFQVSMVVTADNVDQIADVARRLREVFGVRRLGLRAFNAQHDTPPSGFLEQGPDLAVFNAQLARIADTVDSPPAIQVHDVPTCQIDPAVVGRLDLTVVGGPRHAHADCPHRLTCVEGPPCPGISRAYPHRATLRPIDPFAAMTLRAALDGARDAPAVHHDEPAADEVVAESPAAVWVVPVVDGADAVLVIEQVRPGSGYFVAGPEYGLYHHGELPDEAQREKFGRLMRALHLAVADADPATLDLRALEYLVSWVRQRMQDDLPPAPRPEPGVGAP